MQHAVEVKPRRLRAPIVERYERLAVARTARKHALGGHPFLHREQESLILRTADYIREFVLTKPFFSAHDYSWAAEPQNYRDSLEASLQMQLLKSISSLPRDHPRFHDLGNICVRTSPSANMNAQSFRNSGFKYIVLSTSLLKYEWEFLHALDELRPNPRRYIEIPGTRADLNQWTSDDALDCALAKPLALDRLIVLASELARYAVPGGIVAKYKTPNEMKGARARYMLGTVSIADTFIALHELGHLLLHTDSRGVRSASEEIEADNWALTMMNALSVHDSYFELMMMNGCVLAFASTQHFHLCRQAFRHMAHFKGDDPSFDLKEELLGDQELVQRIKGFSGAAKTAGLETSVVSRFNVIGQEMYFLIETTKMRLLDLIMPDGPHRPSQI